MGLQHIVSTQPLGSDCLPNSSPFNTNSGSTDGCGGDWAADNTAAEHTGKLYVVTCVLYEMDVTEQGPGVQGYVSTSAAHTARGKFEWQSTITATGTNQYQLTERSSEDGYDGHSKLPTYSR